MSYLICSRTISGRFYDFYIFKSKPTMNHNCSRKVRTFSKQLLEIHQTEQNGSPVTFNSALSSQVTFKQENFFSHGHEKILTSLTMIHQ